MHTAPRALERHLLVACFALTLAPVIAHGLWRPLLATCSGQEMGMAPRITIASLVMAVLALVAPRASPRHGQSIRCAALCVMAVALSLAMRGGVAASVALVAAAMATLFVAPWCVQRFPHELDGMLTNQRGWFVAWSVLAIAIVVKAALLSTFMGDPAYGQYSLFPKADFLVRHSCLTGYVYAAERYVDGVTNIFEPGPNLGGEVVWNPRYAPFYVDRFPYPPPFLLVPLGLIKIVRGFYAQRALWYGLNGFVIAVVLWLVAQWVGGRRGAIALLLAPWVWLTWGYALQLGNVHGLVMAVAMAAMLAFDKRRSALGGGLLAAVTLAKLAPGLLGVVLLVQRRWRDAAWTFAAAVVMASIGLVILGPKTYESWFTWVLPRLSTGEAVNDVARDPRTIAANLGALSISYKLHLMGLQIDAWRVGKQITTIYTVLVLGLAMLAGRRPAERADQAITWLAVLALASLQSPFAPPYCLGPVYWLVAFVAGEVRTRAGALTLMTLVFATLAQSIPGPPVRLAVLSLCVQAIVFGMLVWVILRKPHS